MGKPLPAITASVEVRKILRTHPRYGYRRIAALLRHQGWDVTDRYARETIRIVRSFPEAK